MHIENLPQRLTKEETAEIIEHWNKDSWKKLAEGNVRLVLHVIKKYSFTDIDEEDLFSIGSIGLVKAAKQFRPECGYEFATYAVPAIQNEILQVIRSERRKIRAVESLDALVGDTEYKLYEVIPDPVSLESTISARGTLSLIVKEYQKTNKTNKKIIRLFLLGYNQSESSHIVGVSQSYISRIIRSLRKDVLNAA